MENNNPILVSIHCLVYNHEPYIRQCLEGFIIQKTDFRFEAIVHDDASTDDSVAIIHEYAEKYPDIIKPIYEIENQYSKKDGSLSRIMNAACKGKYIAICEGDDYWTDPFKLQKQVDVLETYPDISFVYTAFNTVDDKGKLIKLKRSEDFINRSHSGLIFFDLLVYCNFIMTLTTVFRKDIFINVTGHKYDWDYFLNASRMGKAYFIDERTCCYRINPKSVMNTCPQILKAPFYLTVLQEIDLVLSNKDGKTSEEIISHPYKNTVIGYIIARYIRKSTCRRKFLKLLFKYPHMLFYTLKGLFIRLTCDNKFRNKVSKF